VPSVTTALPSLSEQAERLLDLGVHRIAGLPADRLRSLPYSAGRFLSSTRISFPPRRWRPCSG